MSILFSPLALRGITLRNRIGMSPMCQYMAHEGLANSWHMTHLGARAAGGVGLVVAEMTAIEPEARITPGCLGLWSEKHAEAFRPITDFIRGQGAVPAIQLAHAGRRGSRGIPWQGGGALADAWPIPAPSPIAFGTYQMPYEMIPADMGRLIDAFAKATRLAVAAGFELVELHGAHGYLIHSFLSPIANYRTDEYGGSLENRARFPLEVVGAMRSALPESVPLMVRLSCDDWIDGGITLADTIELSHWLKAAGVDLIDCSSGGIVPDEQPPVGPEYQVPFSRTIRATVRIATSAVGLITQPEQAQNVVARGDSDVVLIGRALLENPNWALNASDKLGGEMEWPPPYRRAVHGLRRMNLSPEPW